MPTFEIQDAGSQRLHEVFDHEHEVTIGRGAANTVQLQDGGASKHHATLRHLSGHWKLIDLESRNGTAVNGQLKNQRWLMDGDQIQIGGAVLVWGADGAAQGPPASEPVAARAATPKAVSPKAASPRVPTRAPSPVAPSPVSPSAVPPSSAPPPPVARPPAPVAAAAPVVSGRLLEEEALPAADDAPAFTERSAAPQAGRAPAPARSNRRRREERYDDGYDDDYDDEYDDRPPVRRKDNNAVTITLIGIMCAAAFIGLMLMLGGDGPALNQEVVAEATRIRGRGDYRAALAYINENADPGGEFYHRVRELKDQLERIISQEAVNKRNESAAIFWDKEILRRSRTPWFKAKNALPDEQVVAKLHEFLEKFEGTRQAKKLLHGEEQHEKHFRKLMREYATSDADPSQVLALVIVEVDRLANLKRFGDAIRKLETHAAMHQLRLTRDRAQELRRKAEARLAQLKEDAERAFARDMEEVESAVVAGNKRRARTKLDQIITTYGISKLTAKAHARLAEL